MLAALVRSHRRKFPYELFKEFPQQQGKQLQRLSILLRIAVLLHRSHSDISLPHISYHADGKQLKMEFPAGWLDEHPLTRVDLETEAEFLKSGKFKLLFE